MSDIVLPLTASQVVSRLQAWTTPIVLITTVGTKPTGLAGLILDGNGATGNFSLSLSPANLTAARRWSFPDRTDTVAGLGTQTFTGAQTFTGTQVISGVAAGLTVTGTAATPAQFITFGGTTTASSWFRQTSTGAQHYLGCESSTGGFLFSGSSPYATVFGTSNATALELAINNNVKFRLDSAGEGLFLSTTEATSLTAAALVCNGGAAVAKTLRVGLGIILSGVGNVVAESISTGTTGFGALFSTNDTGCQNQFLTFGSTRAGTTFGLSNNNLCAFYTAQQGGTAPSGLAIGNNGNSPIVFGTNGLSRARINADGAVVLGTDPTGSQLLRVGGALRINSATLISTATAFTNGAGAVTGTLMNAPTVGNPSKWIPIDDNGVTRYIPAW